MNNFVDWFYSGLGGVGGRIIFILVAGVAVLWLILDSRRRHLPSGRWLWAAAAGGVLAVPSLFISARLVYGFLEPAGAVLSAASAGAAAGAAVGFAMRYRGLTGCVRGHPPYSSRHRGCPVCMRMTVPGVPGYVAPVEPDTDKYPATRADSGKLASAWLLAENGERYQLLEGETTLGRDPTSDLHMPDMTVSRVHARIKMEGGRYMIYDLASAGGTWLNGNKVRRPEALDEGDEILLGGGTKLIFTTQPDTLPSKKLMLG